MSKEYLYVGDVVQSPLDGSVMEVQAVMYRDPTPEVAISAVIEAAAEYGTASPEVSEALGRVRAPGAPGREVGAVSAWLNVWPWPARPTRRPSVAPDAMSGSVVSQTAEAPIADRTISDTDKAYLRYFLRLCHSLHTTPERAAAVYVEQENPSARIEQVEAIARYAWKDFDRQREQLMARRHRPSRSTPPSGQEAWL